ncbi:Periplasmic protease [Elusimicrobium minutum Pei191]|uniref:Periplasmic protease n=1 Tax=Elusimicrobium minutum (strain Pei191) TaxID=445932 RepID=B2KE21_ELUMP|nr:S41 family peptidase [Elusimicrobium minutum]ACC98767.1 Periplasmic protease [Elusimicrobium minutum Pei191]
MKNKINRQAVIIAVVFFLGTLFPYAYSGIDNGLQKLKTLVDVIEFVKGNYVEETKFEDLVTNAVKGVVNNLDLFSEYLPPKDYKDLKTETKGEFGGVGIRLTQGDGYLEISSPMPGTPAFEAEIMPKDRITHIDKESVANMTLEEAVEKMRGKIGSKVRLTIMRKKENSEEFETLPDFILKRAKIVPEVVYYRMLEDGIGYIYVIDFSGHTMEKLEQALKSLHKQGMTGLVLDLRFNPGGLLGAAVDMAGKFLGEEKLVVYTQGRRPIYYNEYKAPVKAEYKDLPMVLLVNEASASGSEIVAGALQDHNRAVLIGARTYGKASVQQVQPLGDGSAIRLTIARYYTPLGRLIHRNHKDKNSKDTGGIVPDILIKPEAEDLKQIYTLYNNAVHTPGKKTEYANINDTALDKAKELLKDPEKYEDVLLNSPAKKEAEEKVKNEEGKN